MNDRERAIFLLIGIVLVTVGAGGFDWRYGLISAGILLLLSTKTLWSWIK